MALCKKEQSRGVPLKMGFPDPDVVGVSTKAHFPENCAESWGRPMALCKKEQSCGVPLKMGFSDPDVAGAFL